MSVWLTPDLKPFMGGTYYPPDDRNGRPGFKTLLLRIAEAWKTDRERIVASGDNVLERLQQVGGGEGDGNLDRELLHGAYGQIRASYESRFGGFGVRRNFRVPPPPTSCCGTTPA